MLGLILVIFHWSHTLSQGDLIMHRAPTCPRAPCGAMPDFYKNTGSHTWGCNVWHGPKKGTFGYISWGAEKACGGIVATLWQMLLDHLTPTITKYGHFPTTGLGVQELLVSAVSSSPKFSQFTMCQGA